MRMKLGSMSVQEFYKRTLDESHGFPTALCLVNLIIVRHTPRAAMVFESLS